MSGETTGDLPGGAARDSFLDSFLGLLEGLARPVWAGRSSSGELTSGCKSSLSGSSQLRQS